MMKNVYLIEKDNIKNVYITNNNVIEEGDWFIRDGKLYNEFKTSLTPKVTIFIRLYSNLDLSEQWREVYISDCKKIILTTDQLLIKDGVQAIDDEFLEWVSNNIDCEYVEVISAKSDVCNCYYPKFCKSTMLDYKTHCGEGENIKDYFKIIIPERESKKEILEHKSKFIVFILENDNWVQESIPLNSFEEADEFCQHLRDRKISYLICKTLKQGYNGN